VLVQLIKVLLVEIMHGYCCGTGGAGGGAGGAGGNSISNASGVQLEDWFSIINNRFFSYKSRRLVEVVEILLLVLLMVWMQILVRGGDGAGSSVAVLMEVQEL
jgi:hypothetical protein